MTSTQHTSITLKDDKYVLTGGDGWDGFVRKEFDLVEDALDYQAYLWGMNSFTENVTGRPDLAHDTHPNRLRRIIKR